MAYGGSVKFEIVKHVCVLSDAARGWKKELNLVSWNDRAPKYDIREWDPTHERMGKGVTLTVEELTALVEGASQELGLKDDGELMRTIATLQGVNMQGMRNEE